MQNIYFKTITYSTFKCQSDTPKQPKINAQGVNLQSTSNLFMPQFHTILQLPVTRAENKPKNTYLQMRCICGPNQRQRKTVQKCVKCRITLISPLRLINWWNQQRRYRTKIWPGSNLPSLCKTPSFMQKAPFEERQLYIIYAYARENHHRAAWGWCQELAPETLRLPALSYSHCFVVIR